MLLTFYQLNNLHVCVHKITPPPKKKEASSSDKHFLLGLQIYLQVLQLWQGMFNCTVLGNFTSFYAHQWILAKICREDMIERLFSTAKVHILLRFWTGTWPISRRLAGRLARRSAPAASHPARLSPLFCFSRLEH